MSALVERIIAARDRLHALDRRDMGGGADVKFAREAMADAANHIQALEAALAPFVRLVGDWPSDWPDDDYAALDADAMMEPITIGDFRRAKAALT